MFDVLFCERCLCGGCCDDVECVCGECKRFMVEYRKCWMPFLFLLGVVFLVVWTVLYSRQVSPFTEFEVTVKDIPLREGVCGDNQGYCWYGFIHVVYVYDNQERTCTRSIPSEQWTQGNVKEDIRRQFPIESRFHMYSKTPQSDDTCVFALNNPWEWLIAGSVCSGVVLMCLFIELVIRICRARQTKNKHLRGIARHSSYYNHRQPVRSSRISV
jgi:hypothetical protein